MSPARTTRLAWLGGGALIALAVAIAAGPFFAGRTLRAVEPGTGSAEHLISVPGTGIVTVVPDVCRIQIGVSVTRPTAAGARADAAEAMAKVMAALKAAGIADKDIQTSTLSLQPVYDYSMAGSEPRLTGYQMANGVTVSVRAFDQIAKVVDDSVAAGATSVDSIAFLVDDPTGAEAQAREAAMNDAKRRAEELARQAGVSIVGVATVTETGAMGVQPTYLGRVADVAGASAPTPVQVGTSQVMISVSVAYVIG